MPFSLKPKAIAGFVLGISASCANAGLINAGSVDIEFDRYIFREGSDTVKVYYPDGPDGDTSSDSSRVRAGMFHGDALEPDDDQGFAGFDPLVLYRGLEEVLLYCIDLYQGIRGGQRVTYDVLALDSPTGNVLDGDGKHPGDRNFDRTLDFLGALNVYLAGDDFSFTEGEYNWLNPDEDWMSGAIQIGIWESLYEDGDTLLDVTSGDFRVKTSGNWKDTLDDRGLALLSNSFGLMADTKALDPSKVLVLTSGRYQDMIVGDPPAPVPAPAPAALMLAGLILLARRRTGPG